MRNGFRVYDSDTHVNPAAEILDKYVGPEFRLRLPELAPYRARVGRAVDGPSELHNYRCGSKYYRRILGEAAPRDNFSGRDSKWMGSRRPRPGIQDDQASNRVLDMDDEGTDVHFLIPTSWLSLVGLDDTSIEVAMIRAYHRHMADFCGQFPERLKSPIIASARQPGEAVREIRQWGKSPWAVAVMPLLAEGLPADHPSLAPIWQEAQEFDLPIANHSFTWAPPYYPGYRDLWDNIFLGRLAAHPWGAMRFVAAFIGGGLYDQYPALRMGVLECGFGWLPFWAKRMDEQAEYVGATAPLKLAPSEYMKSGRFCCSIEHHEGEDMLHDVTRFLGEDVLMYASDYPHSECQFPDSVTNILAWSSLGVGQQRKLLSENADRFFRWA
ncbi:MAG TPA: amidohydrolase family protein [Acetobacteraceae bacterium]|nr:amidohydrolase family protein [Acetobacteraceae bacterium]